MNSFYLVSMCVKQSLPREYGVVIRVSKKRNISRYAEETIKARFSS